MFESRCIVVLFAGETSQCPNKASWRRQSPSGDGDHNFVLPGACPVRVCRRCTDRLQYFSGMRGAGLHCRI